MKYVEPRITNVLKADSVIQGMSKDSIHAETGVLPSDSPAYRADE
ncbi:hypothetical protein HNQ77_000944 [Silvibacterium bohemicum]|uniref:Uncharacterized protein n=1 Tax=Silvibacterium bohemicum TaxID=1577686 RepID=A0A841JPC3_9BACT|nr:hypothetical protein [Silvibacterium bohemicum]MBB6143000.1 hypothetical protein [Silvibacterium bohemicum]